MKDLITGFWFSFMFAIAGVVTDAIFLYLYFTNSLAVDSSNPNAGIAILILGLVVGTVPLLAGIGGMIRSQLIKGPSA